MVSRQKGATYRELVLPQAWLMCTHADLIAGHRTSWHQMPDDKSIMMAEHIMIAEHSEQKKKIVPDKCRSGKVVLTSVINERSAENEFNRCPPAVAVNTLLNLILSCENFKQYKHTNA